MAGTKAGGMQAAATNKAKRSRKTQIWGKDVDWVELKCGLKIAKEDYWEIGADGEKKLEFTQDEAIGIREKTGGKYRVPTISEWARIIEEVGVEGGYLSRDKVVETLELTEDESGWGNYWSSTISATNYGYYLAFDASYMYPATSPYRLDGFPVRCVMVERKK